MFHHQASTWYAAHLKPIICSTLQDGDKKILAAQARVDMLLAIDTPPNHEETVVCPDVPDE